jgi:anaerobic ribonucleoside-triphosphate reductase activating protein
MIQTDVRIAGIVPESIVDGPGFRYVVFTQGCPHDCPGCHNADSHDPAGGKVKPLDEIIREMQKNELIDGLTLSGGEPFCQAEACARLAAAAKAKGLNVWVYSGYTFEELLQGMPNAPGWEDLLNTCDVLVDGRFELRNRSLALRFRGSQNQRIIDLPASLKARHVIEYPV